MTRAETLTQRQSNIQPPLITPKRSGLGVRKVLIGIVAGLFVLGLVSTVSDLIAKPTASNLATITTPKTLLQQLLLTLWCQMQPLIVIGRILMLHP